MQRAMGANREEMALRQELIVSLGRKDKRQESTEGGLARNTEW